MAKFTADTAREMALRSHGPDSARFLPKPQPEPVREMAVQTAQFPAQSAEMIDRFSADLSTVCEETLVLLRKAKKPMERAQLARSLRDLRETWHLATGKPRPGLAKEQSGRMARREMPRITPPVPGESVDQVVYGHSTPEVKPS